MSVVIGGAVIAVGIVLAAAIVSAGIPSAGGLHSVAAAIREHTSWLKLQRQLDEEKRNGRG